MLDASERGTISVGRKRSIKRSAQTFKGRVDDILGVVSARIAGASDEHVSWIHDYAVIRLYREFESLVLDALVGAVNNDTSTLSLRTSVQFPKHLTDEVCEYVITGGGYFDFKGRDGLIKTLKRYVPEAHYLVSIVKKSKYKAALEQLSSLRNFAAHDSDQSKRAALTATGQQRIGSAGAWLKRQGRLGTIASRLKELADEIDAAAPR